MTNPFDIEKDGTGQRQRRLAAADPGFFQLDERTPAELLAYAQQLSTKIRYVNALDQEEGNWGPFLALEKPGLSKEDIAAFLEDPGRFARDPQKLAWLSRPHFVLWLAFLELHGRLRQDMNQFSRRHADFYYREVLGLKPSAARPDSVHVLLELARGIAQYPLAEGTLLQAGKDNNGRPRSYRIAQDLMVGRAEVADIRTVFMDRKFLSLREFHRLEKNFIEVLKLVYGSGDGRNPIDNELKINGESFLTDKLKPLLDFSATHFSLSLSEWRRLMQLKKRRDEDDGQWVTINNFLREAGKTKNGNNWESDSQFKDRKLKEFAARFGDALGFSPFPTEDPKKEDPLDPFQTNLQGVTDLFDLYEQLEEQLAKRANSDANFDEAKLEAFRKFIGNDPKDGKLFMPVDDSIQPFATDFRKMMELLVSIRNDWAGINKWLAKAGASQRKPEDYKPNWPELPQTPKDPDLSDFDIRFAEALQNPFPAKIPRWGIEIPGPDAYQAALEAVESYFFLPYEDVLFMVNNFSSMPDEIYTLLEKAFREKELVKGRTILLSKLTNDDKDIKEPAARFIATLKYALGEKEGEDWPELNGKTDTIKIIENLNTEDSITKRYLKENVFLSHNDFNKYVAGLYQRIVKPSPEDDLQDDLDHLVQLLEAARRRKRGLTDPIPGKETFSGIFAQNHSESAIAAPGETMAWPVFGGNVVAETTQAALGLAICSPLLHLAEGERTIKLNITFQGLPQGKNFHEYFDFELSTLDTWLKISPTLKDNIISLTIHPEDTPITAPSPGLFPGDPSNPVLKITLKQIGTDAKTPHPYTLLKDVRITQIDLSVTVAGLTPTLAENDNGPVNPAKPFDAFGTAPAKGSALLLAHRELCFKPLEKIGFTFNWLKIVGNSIQDHYGNYSSNLTNNDVKASLSLVRQGVVLNAPKTNIPLFSSNPLAFKTEEEIKPEQSGKIIDWSRYLRLELETDLLHAAYPAIAAEKAMAFAKNPSGNDLKNFKLNPPYTPHLKSLKLYYESTITLLGEKANASDRHRVLHLHPFGHTPLTKETRAAHPESQYYLLPEYQQEGECCIGLRHAEPPEQISLLIQMAESAANPDLEKPPIAWHYLTAGGWKTFGLGDILRDETNDLAQSGVFQFLLPADAVRDHPLLPTGLHWIRASQPSNRQSVGQVVGIYAQAATAIRVADPDSSDDPGTALPPDTIKGFYDRQPGIKKVAQPFASFGGVSAESEAAFQTRAAERLRHRHRALASWDVEHLVLQHFPDVYRAKCLRATNPATGEVNVVLIPDTRGRALFDLFAPKLPIGRLREIGAFLDGLGSPLARFRPINPTYLPITVKAWVRFRPGFDPRYYLGQLNEDLKRFLSPWAYDTREEVAFNNIVYASTVVHFMEKRPYVDYVTNLKLYIPGAAGNTLAIKPDHKNSDFSPETILVSSPKHFLFNEVDQLNALNRQHTGIGFMQVQVDFIVQPNDDPSKK